MSLGSARISETVLSRPGEMAKNSFVGWSSRGETFYIILVQYDSQLSRRYWLVHLNDPRRLNALKYDDASWKLRLFVQRLLMLCHVHTFVSGKQLSTQGHGNEQLAFRFAVI